jgi:hypothetical protein
VAAVMTWLQRITMGIVAALIVVGVVTVLVRL